jgi:hypothetical protein
VRPLHRAALTICSLLALAACKPGSTSGEGPETVPPASGDAAPAPAAKPPIEIYESLEASIASGDDSRKIRDHALEEIRGAADDGTAAYAFSRAAIAGRVAEKRGLQAGELVSEAESWAIKAREREPDFREGAATRLLGTLYVMAPPRLVEHGDSETGLEILEAEVEAHPERLIGRVRLAEAYIALGDPEPAFPHLCAAVLGREGLSAEERKLLDKLVEDAGGEGALGCAAAGE